MIPCTQTVIDEGTMMVIIIGALVTNRTMKRLFRNDHLTENAQIVQVYVVLKEIVNQLYEIEFGPQIARVHPNRQAERDERDQKEEDTKTDRCLL